MMEMAGSKLEDDAGPADMQRGTPTLLQALSNHPHLGFAVEHPLQARQLVLLGGGSQALWRWCHQPLMLVCHCAGKGWRVEGVPASDLGCPARSAAAERSTTDGLAQFPACPLQPIQRINHPSLTAVQQAGHIKHGAPLCWWRLRNLPPLACGHIPQVQQAVCIRPQAEAGAKVQQGGDDAAQGRAVLGPLGL